jgi:hypothetical protein
VKVPLVDRDAEVEQGETVDVLVAGQDGVRVGVDRPAEEQHF